MIRIDKFSLPTDRCKDVMNLLSALMRDYTMSHIMKRGGVTWSTEMQLLHCQSEIAEVYEAIRHDEPIDQICHEIVDIICSGFTTLDIALMNYYQDNSSEPEISQTIKQKVISDVFDKITDRLVNDKYVGIDNSGDDKTEYKRVD